MSVVIEILIAIVLLVIIYIRRDRRNSKRNFVYSYAVLIGLFSISVFTITLAEPRINLKKPLSVEVMSSEKMKIPKTFYLGFDITDRVIVNGNIDYKKVGKYKVVLEIPTLFETYEKECWVEVVDTVPPHIYLDGGDHINYSYSKEYEEIGVSAKDDYEGDLTDHIQQSRKIISDNKIDIEYTVQDSSGNMAKVVRHITLIDDVAPIITLNGEEKMTLYKGNVYQELGAGAIDEKEGDLSGQIQIEGNVDSTKVGTYLVHYTVSDSKGNSASKDRVVQVVDFYSNGTIYLTFDDGPGAYTSKLLDILKKYDVKATFFVTNQGLTSGYDAMIKRAYDEGHTIGLHTYSHDYNTVYASEEAYFQDLDAIGKKVKDITGYESKIIRFPGGSSNTISSFNPGIMSRLAVEVERRGYRYFDWNVSGGDAGGASSATQVFNNVLRGINGKSDYVVLQHDIKEYSVDAVENIILYGLQNGYSFRALDMNSPTAHHGINN